MITIKSEQEIRMMHEAGKQVAALHKEIAKIIRPGITTLQIDAFAEQFMTQIGATPEQKGFNGYRFATCASINDEICHGFPNERPLQDGDIVTIDFVINLNGSLADSAWTYAVGSISEEAHRLMEITKQSMYKGIEQALIGNRLGDIGQAIQSFVEPTGFSVVRDFCGHGVGPTLHEDPQVPHYGKAGTGLRLKEGMVITIEPMVNTGGWHAKMDLNDWTARTVDGSLSAQYEHTVAITANGPLILTAQD
ncbi:type I methionyl aminopeptidase [Paenibacillus sp. UNC451MF]|uniref:type I methionyl aminopeptidase n=1 Tax=Paenibacillus sp. UNC451MF TaxID=1449063 RepID=UPI00048B051A|nr:type I methionyl aminopeptidase [Paenibacillus sp. UNC451MF]